MLKKIHITGTFFVLTVGSLLHFVYEWSGCHPGAALFAPVNESVWEHLKLIWVPYAVFAVAEFFIYGRKKADFLAVRILCFHVSAVGMVVLYYTYSGILGTNLLAVDILLFVLCSVGMYLLSYYCMRNNRLSSPDLNAFCRVLTALTTVCFIVWSYNPPSIGLFR